MKAIQLTAMTLFLMFATNLNAQNVRTLNFTVTGMFQGLTVNVVAATIICPPAGGFVEISLGSSQLTEQSNTHWAPDGNGGLQLVTTIQYVGSLTVNMPPDNGCPSSLPFFDGAFSYKYQILGEDELGQLSARISNPFPTSINSPSPNYVDKLEGKTQPITGLVTVAKNLTRTVAVNYKDPFGGGSVIKPSLDFQQNGLINGVPATISRGKLSLSGENNESVCLRVGISQQCRLRSEGGTLNLGNVTVFVGSITTISSIPAPDVLRVEWRFRLEPLFPAGEYTLVATADDKDPIRYFVDGEPQPINLILWKALRQPVTVVE